MRIRPLLIIVTALSAWRPAPSLHAQQAGAPDVATIRRELERQYEANNRAMRAEDVAAVMALRTDDFHAVSPDGTRSDRAEMEHRTVGLFNGIERWISLSIVIDSLEVVGDLAHAEVRQHLVRMAIRPDNNVHHVETWATQRETWRKTPTGWKLYRVDNVRDQKRLVDGQPG